MCANAAGQAESNGLGDTESPSFEMDCNDPANASSPKCLECQGPNAFNNPYCQTGTGLQAATGAQMGDGSTGGSNFGSAEQYDSAPAVGQEGLDQTQFGGPTASQAQSNGVGLGAPGGMPGAGAGGAPGLGGDGAGNRRGAGHNANVLKGVAGGGGYQGGGRPSGSRVGVASGGGFGGYSRSKKSGGSGLDLKQFLPGGKKDPRKRNLAGLARRSGPPIGRKEENIFNKMAKKYQQMCKLKRMWDCPKSKK